MYKGTYVFQIAFPLTPLHQVKSVMPDSHIPLYYKGEILRFVSILLTTSKTSLLHPVPEVSEKKSFSFLLFPKLPPYGEKNNMLSLGHNRISLVDPRSVAKSYQNS